MTKLFKDATAYELHNIAKGLVAHMTGGLGFKYADVVFRVTEERVTIHVSSHDGQGSSGEISFIDSPEMDDELNDVIGSLWRQVNKAEPADKRHLRAMMRQLGDTLEAFEAFESASVEAFRARIRAMRDDMGARLIEGPKS